MEEGLLGVNAGVDHIGSNVFDHTGPSVGIVWHQQRDRYIREHGVIDLNFSLSDFTMESEGMDVGLRGGGIQPIAGPFGILGRARVDFVRDLGNGENYHGLLFGGEGGVILDFEYVDLNITGGLGIGFMDRNDVGRFDTHYTGSALLDINFWSL